MLYQVLPQLADGQVIQPPPLPQLASSQLEEVLHILQNRNWDETSYDS